MTVEFRGVSTASLGAMLKGYGIIAGVAAEWPDARFWWTASGFVATEVAELDDSGVESARTAIEAAIWELGNWAKHRGKKFQKPRGYRDKRAAGDPPLEDEANWDLFGPALAEDAEGAGAHAGETHRANPVLARWGQDGSGNLFSALREAGENAKRDHVRSAIFDESGSVGGGLRKGTGVLFPEGIKRYATGTQWVHDSLKPLGQWDFILAMRGLLLLRGAVRLPRGTRRAYPSFPFVLPGSVVLSQGSATPTQEVFLPTWNADRPRTLGEFQAQVRGFQARVGRQDFASGAAGFRRAVEGRAVTGGFSAFHRFALEPRKPGRSRPQRQAISRGTTTVGPASSVRHGLRSLLAPLDDSGWLDRFVLRWTDGKPEADSAKLARGKARFDEAVHSAIDVPEVQGRLSVLKALWNLQLELWTVSERSGGTKVFQPAPLLKGSAWRLSLSDLLEHEPASRLGWALASLGWPPAPDENGRPRPIVEQLLPVLSVGKRRLYAPQGDDQPRQRVRQPGRKPEKELAGMFWRRWIDTASLPVLPATGTRPAHVEDVTALLRGEVSVKDVQRYFLAFLMLDGSGHAAPPPPASDHRPLLPAYASLRLWLELSARPQPGERRPMDGAVPRGIATGTGRSVADAAKFALRRLRVAGLPGRWPDGTRPTAKRVATPRVHVTSREAGLMATAVLVPISCVGVDRLAHTLVVPSARQERASESKKEIVDVQR
ncbi:MAG: hypothetical protein F4Z31_17715 [Gemmatimonadetes bacterium]|nr:hypothetical protein [Gemmatimonadota bacterium]MYE93038.1 hypothetical protein [Gemmatimonadota bacterium]MYJ10218.1 hypothetical protein [Gemmatimonadota bacterium]